MALADVHRCKRYLNIRANSTAKDALIAELLASAKGMIDTFLALLSQERASSVTSTTWPSIQSYRRGVIAGESAIATTVTVISLTSLALEADYATRIEPQLNQDLVDTVAHLYRHRSPNSTSETEGGGINESWDDVGTSGLPKRVERRLRNLIATIEA